MPSSVIGALRVSLGLDSAQFERGADRAEHRAGTMAKRLATAIAAPINSANLLRGAIVGIAGSATVAAFAGATQRAFDFADAIADLADRTGASTKLIQEFRYAAQMSGSSVETADEALGKFTKTLGMAQAGSDAQVKLFRELGVTSGNFDTAFRQTLQGLSKLPTVQERNAAALQIFGKSAGTLTALLGEGAAGFDEMAQRANDLGIVLREDVIRNAGQVNDQLDTMKMVLNAQFANVITQNANAIASLGQSMADLTSAIIRFFGSNPEKALAIIGALGGGAAGFAVGGPIGAAVGVVGGAAAGAYGGRKVREAGLAGNRKWKASQDLENWATAEQQRLMSEGASRAALERIGKIGLRARATRQRIEEGVANGTISNAPAAAPSAVPVADGGMRLPGTGKAEAAAAARAAEAARKKAEADAARAAREAEQREKAYQGELARTTNELQDAQAGLATEVTARAQFERDRIKNDRDQAIAAIRADEDLTEAQKQRLTTLHQQIAQAKTDLADRSEREATAAEELDLAQARKDNEVDELQARANLARTAKERRRVEQQILDAQFDVLRATQEAVLTSETATANDKAIARERMRTLGKLQAYATQENNRQNAGPLAQYFDSLPQSADEMNEAFERIQADGLSDLIDGIATAKGDFKSLADVVDNVADQIIASLLKIGLQKGLAAIFGSLFPNSNASGSITELFGNGSAGRAPSAMGAPYIPDLSGARAGGGPVIGGRNYLVGELGPEIFTAPHSGNIIANEDIAGRRQGPVVQLVVGEGQMFEPRVAGISGDVSVETVAASNRTGALRGRQQLGGR